MGDEFPEYALQVDHVLEIVPLVLPAIQSPFSPFRPSQSQSSRQSPHKEGPSFPERAATRPCIVGFKGDLAILDPMALDSHPALHGFGSPGRPHHGKEA
jgi:hypothetical protein